MLKGTISEANGDFNIEAFPIMAPLKLTVSAPGFEAYTQTVTFQPKMPAGAAQTRPAAGQMPDFSAMASAFEKDLGKVNLVKSVKELSEVEFAAESDNYLFELLEKSSRFKKSSRTVKCYNMLSSFYDSIQVELVETYNNLNLNGYDIESLE